jgi:hypothetical protein
MPPVGFEPTMPVSEQPLTHALDRTATGIGRFEPTIPESERPHTHDLDRAATGIGEILIIMGYNLLSRCGNYVYHLS